MLGSGVLKMLAEKVFFLGTACDNVPRVRPMKPFVDKAGNIWLVSHAAKGKIAEIEFNNTVELCTVGDNFEVVRLQGRLVANPGLYSSSSQELWDQLGRVLPAGVFSGPDDPSLVVYQFLVDNVIFRDEENEENSELNFRLPQK